MSGQARRLPVPGHASSKNILERASALSTGSRIEADDIQIQVTAGRAADDDANGLGERLDSVQRDAIQKALEANRYNKTAAARQLGDPAGPALPDAEARHGLTPGGCAM